MVLFFICTKALSNKRRSADMSQSQVNLDLLILLRWEGMESKEVNKLDIQERNLVGLKVVGFLAPCEFGWRLWSSFILWWRCWRLLMTLRMSMISFQENQDTHKGFLTLRQSMYLLTHTQTVCVLVLLHVGSPGTHSCAEVRNYVQKSLYFLYHCSHSDLLGSILRFETFKVNMPTHFSGEGRDIRE